MINLSNTFIFDLDRTIWDTYSKYNNPIWAKQMLPPYEFRSGLEVVDDCFSVCRLHSGVAEFLKLLNESNKSVGFLSRGALYNEVYTRQPSIKLLELFGIYDLFNYKKILFYKSNDKGAILREIVEEKGDCVFIDDMKKDIDSANMVPGVNVINRYSFNSWEEFLKS